MQTIPKFFCTMALMAATGAFAADVFVIAHPSVTLTGDEVHDVFVGEKQLAGAVKLVPMDNAALQADFLSKVVKVDAAKYQSIWTKKGFRDGITAPPSKSGDAEVISAVKATPGAVGYVSKAPADMKVIQKF